MSIQDHVIDVVAIRIFHVYQHFPDRDGGTVRGGGAHGVEKRQFRRKNGLGVAGQLVGHRASGQDGSVHKGYRNAIINGFRAGYIQKTIQLQGLGAEGHIGLVLIEQEGEDSLPLVFVAAHQRYKVVETATE